MSNKKGPAGCYLIFLIVVFGSMFLYEACDEKFYRPKRDAKRQAELIQFWSAETLEYFKDFDCEKLSEQENEIKISKFFLIESYLNSNCNISKYTVNEFDTIAKLKPYFTKKIAEANVIIWIKIFDGGVEGRYTDSSPAHRLNAEINFIDKNTNKIFKKEIVKFTGNPMDYIEKRQRDKPSDVYFGEKPYWEISKTILNYIN